MGVKGLQTFLKNNEQYLATKESLSNTSLVIDANNLLCLLYTRTCLDRNSDQHRNDIYGGDLVFYAQNVKEFFESLDKCKITPILVFDGSVIGKAALKEFVASKENEVYQRGLERFNRAKTADEFSFDGDLLLPQTINIVFRNIANDAGIQRIQAPYEADSHIARVANELNCPVLTNDSDFIIYDLKQGFLMLDSFEYKTPIAGSKPGEVSIRCSLFSQARMAKALPGISKEIMPLLSILLGNDYVEAGTFDGVMRSICNRHYDGFFEARTFNHRRIANLLTWMRGRSLQESIDYILRLVHQVHRPKLEKLINLFMLNYRIESVDDFDLEIEQIYPSNKVDPKLVELGQAPVQFLRKHMEQDDLGSIALDMIFLNTHYNYSILDDHTLPSSSYIKFRPYSLALVLLRRESHVNLTSYRRRIEAERSAFHIFDRVHDSYTKLSIKQMENLEKFGPLLHLDCYTMITMEPALKRNMLMACFYFNTDEMSLMTDTVGRAVSGPFVQEAALCFMLVKYIALETKLPPKSQFVDALMVTIFYYAALSGHINKDGIPNEGAFGKMLLKLRPHSKTNNGIVYANRDQSLYRRIMHFISQLHCAYKAYCLINSLLDHALHPPRSERFLNSTLVFRLTKLFRLGEFTLQDLCADMPTLIDICGSIQAQVHCAT
uniref:Protein asteroid 1 n=1 Tax=Aceria tosichella TaxID=561515 RepID=A0A6G1SH69_9ACAR